jgi:ribosomal protein S12 methylthiotransferase accessory factor
MLQKSQTNLQNLVQPLGGLISRVIHLPHHPGEPRFPIMSSSLGDVGQVLSNVTNAGPPGSTAHIMDGTGGSVAPEESRIKAIAEGLERYSSCVYDEKQFIWATADELGDEALDLSAVPRCSESELRHPRCPIVTPDKAAPIRWARGISLLDGRLIWVPAVMVYLHISFLSPGERFWLPISTGCAAHASLEQALISAISEIIERDAVSLVWLQRLPLPRIELDDISDELQRYLDLNRRGNFGIEHYFFDATLDVGVPTVYSLHLSPGNDKLSSLVMCSTELDPSVAVAKVLRESSASRIAMQTSRELPAELDDFNNVHHGAMYMGKQERLHVYEFLLNSPQRRLLSEMPVITGDDSQAELINLIERLRERKMEAYAVDLSTDEALRVGMRVVRVIIPALQPLSFNYRAQYLGHPRLYDAPRRMGYPVHNEAELNRWPQPFA